METMTMLSRVQFLAFAERKYKDAAKGTFRVAQCLILGDTDDETLVGEFWLFDKELKAEEGRIYVAEYEVSRDYENRIGGRLIAFHPEGTKVATNTSKLLRIVSVQQKTSKSSGNKYQVAQCVLKDDKGILVGVLPVYDASITLDKGEFHAMFGLGVDYQLRIVPRLISLSPAKAAVAQVSAPAVQASKEAPKQ